MTGATFICGGDESPGPRDPCPDTLHDYPLPVGYVDRSEVAHRRLYKRWRNVRCRQCGLYGWVPPLGDTTEPVKPPTTEPQPDGEPS